ncbi:hypothetical protein [Parasphingorhabdus pacifica]
MSTTPPANTLLTPLAAFAGTLAGVLVLFYAQVRMVPALAGGIQSICRHPDCVLGLGVWLIVGAFAALCASVIVSTIVAFRHRQPAVRAALRRGMWVSGWCLLAYVVESAAVWMLVLGS